MEQQHPLNDLMSTAMEKIRTMVDANTIIGTPIQTGDVTLIPVSRLSFGIASGGSDFVTKSQKPEQPKNFGGGRIFLRQLLTHSGVLVALTRKNKSYFTHFDAPRRTGSAYSITSLIISAAGCSFLTIAAT